MKALITATALSLSWAAAAQPVRDPAEANCGENSVHLLILGTYHMANPGLDAINLEADDVLSPRRQAEIAELNAALLRFQPTKVAVEGDYRESAWRNRYKTYLAGTLQLGRNEIEQIAMKLARASGHETIYPIDFPMLMSGLRYDEVEFKPNPKTEAESPEPRQLSEEELLMRRLSVGEYLRVRNDPDRIAADHAGYMRFLIPDRDKAAIYEHSDYLLNWYKRNIRMMANVARVSEPGDRVFLLVGAGHLQIMRDFAIDSPNVCLWDALRYLPEASK